MKREDMRPPIQEVKIEGGGIKDVAVYAEKILLLQTRDYTFSDKKEWYEVSVADLAGRKLWEKKYAEYPKYFNCLVDGKHVLTEENGNGLKIYDIYTGERIRSFAFHEKDAFAIKNVAFSEDASYFSMKDEVFSIWEYGTGRRIAAYEKQDGLCALLWMGRNTYLLSKKSKSIMDSSHSDELAFTWNKILPDGNIEAVEKEQISDDVNCKIYKTERRNNLLKAIDEKSVCTVVDGHGRYGFFEYVSYMDPWDVENEAAVFSFTGGNEILDVVFLPERNQFILIEMMRNKSARVSFWNLETKQKERTVFLQGMKKNVRREKLRVIKGGEELVSFEEGGAVKVWRLD